MEKGRAAFDVPTDILSSPMRLVISHVDSVPTAVTLDWCGEVIWASTFSRIRNSRIRQEIQSLVDDQLEDCNA